MWFTVKYAPENDRADTDAASEVIVTVWGHDERPLRTGGALRSIADIVAFLRFATGPGGTTAPRCGVCDTAVDLPDPETIARAG